MDSSVTGSAAGVLSSVVVLAKQPLPGRAKTRLAPPLTLEHAACVAAAALRDTLQAVARIPCGSRVLAFDGDATSWCPGGWRHVVQVSGGLDRRIAAALQAAGPGPSVLVGMDTPQLTAAHLTAWDLARYDACLGPAADGGYWALGLAEPGLADAAVLGVPMSADVTGEVQLARLHDLGLRVQVLDTLTDVDTIDTARHVAALVPDSDFAAALGRAEQAA